MERPTETTASAIIELKAVGKSFWNKKHFFVAFRQFLGNPFAISFRVFS